MSTTDSHRVIMTGVVTERLAEEKVPTLDRRHYGSMRPRHVDALRLLPMDGG